MALSVGRPLPAALLDAEVLDAQGEPSRFGDHFKGVAAVLVFLRHFACIGCSEHVAVLARRLEEFRRLGLKVIYIGNGTPNYIQGFIERNGLDPDEVDLITDPSLGVFEAAALERSFTATYGPRALLNAARAFLSGFGQGRTQGDDLQQGGVIVADAESCVAYYHRDRATGDHAPTTDVVDSAMRVAALAADSVIA